jgi:hypothetical protein
MATVFPFDKIPKIPLKILTVLLPVFLKQKKLLTKIAADIEHKAAGLSKNVSCGDAQIAEIKNDLERLKLVAENIQKITNVLPTVTNSLKTVTTVANVLITIQLAIPAIVGVPEGPKSQLLTALAELTANITIILNVLNTIVSTISNINDIATVAVSFADARLKSICNEDLDTSASDASEVSTSSSSGLTNPQLNSQYPSQFYRDINVSDADLQDRIDTIQTLLDEQLNVMSNLQEAPSKVLLGTGTPSLDLGKIGDYYIDTDTQTVYGPKPTINSWR